MKITKTESGSAHVIIIIVLLIAVIGLLGFVFWQNFIQKGSQNTQTAQATNQSTTQAQTAVPKIDAAKARTVVDNFYSEYYQASVAVSSQQTADVNAAAAVVAKYGTGSLIKDYSNTAAYDKVLCAQNLPATAPVSTNYTVNGDSTKVDFTVKEDFQAGSPGVVATVVDQGGLKVDSVTCTIH